MSKCSLILEEHTCLSGNIQYYLQISNPISGAERLTERVYDSANEAVIRMKELSLEYNTRIEDWVVKTNEKFKVTKERRTS